MERGHVIKHNPRQPRIGVGVDLYGAAVVDEMRVFGGDDTARGGIVAVRCEAVPHSRERILDYAAVF
ncbi:MAG: hypothetical protein IKO46_12935, partial [Salinivirgaceae bacterium]|nr:hypothetical protein [Salinivirgaceae bacterium]